MDYLVVMAENGELINVSVEGASGIEVIDYNYFNYGQSGSVLFTAPTDSVVYIQAKRTIH